MTARPPRQMLYTVTLRTPHAESVEAFGRQIEAMLKATPADIARLKRAAKIGRMRQAMTDAASFKPSQIRVFASFPPFVDTFRNAEAEASAALIVRALALRGDTWRTIELREVGEVLKADLTADPPDDTQKLVKTMLGNPFWRPEPARLVAGGFATFDDPQAPKAIGFTPMGIDRLAKWGSVKP